MPDNQAVIKTQKTGIKKGEVTTLLLPLTDLIILIKNKLV
jgi:hypothetical protein